MIEHHSICELPRGVLFQITTKSRADSGRGKDVANRGNNWRYMAMRKNLQQLVNLEQKLVRAKSREGG